MVSKELLSKRILHAYDLDARLSYAALSRKIGPSRDIIQKIISDYEVDQTIKGYITVIDIGKLGYIGVAVYARLDTADPKKQQKIFEKLNNRKEIYWIAQLGGRYDILFAIQAKSILQFSEILSDIQKEFQFVTNSQFAIRTRATQFQRSYLLERETNRIEGGFKVTDEVVTLNENEKKIIRLLVEDPRMQVVELAKKAKVSRITATSIIKRLENGGIIQQCSALISCQNLGFESFLIQVTLKRFDESIRQKVRKFAGSEPGIIFCIESIGQWHNEFHCEVPSQRHLQQLIRKFRETFPLEVQSLEVVPCFDYYYKYKYTI